MSAADFAAQVRAKYPGAYDDLSDADLTQKIFAKYPQYQDSVETPTMGDFFKSQMGKVFSAKGLIHAVGLPANMDEARQMADAQSKKSLLQQLRESPAMGAIMPGGMGGQILGDMAKNEYRAFRDPRDPMSGVRAVAGLDPFAAPTISRMDEQGFGTPESGSTGVVNLAPMIAGEAVSRFGPIASDATTALRGGMRSAGRYLQENAPAAASFVRHPIRSAASGATRRAMSGGGRLLEKMGGGPAVPDTSFNFLENEKPLPEFSFLSDEAAPAQSYSPQPLEVPPTPESGTWSADPRTGEEILQSVQNMRKGGQGKVAMQEGEQPAPAAPTPRSSRPGFGTATVPIEERMDMSQFYGKTEPRSLLRAHQRQMASPTFSTAPGQPPPPTEFVPKTDMTPEDYAFQDENMEDILAVSLGRLRLIDKMSKQ